ncbi:hypothetical protein ACFYNL_11165 [Streptomyces sp. NPDC007808]|uniref:hypothetical protein n=1 Tax=Streptomyces sp. NPDC007808 TaxID=3364779 RepID=UPI0036AF551A
MKHDNRIEDFESTDVVNLSWCDTDALRLLCRVAGEAGFLDGVEVLPLAIDPAGTEFLLTVDVGDGVLLASGRCRWSELQPPDGMSGIEAARHVLGRLDGIARRTRIGLGAYTWMRVASGLEEVRAILERAGKG